MGSFHPNGADSCRLVEVLRDLKHTKVSASHRYNVEWITHNFNQLFNLAFIFSSKLPLNSLLLPSA